MFSSLHSRALRYTTAIGTGRRYWIGHLSFFCLGFAKDEAILADGQYVLIERPSETQLCVQLT
jgi:hypothetical protein